MVIDPANPASERKRLRELIRGFEEAVTLLCSERIKAHIPDATENDFAAVREQMEQEVRRLKNRLHQLEGSP